MSKDKEPITMQNEPMKTALTQLKEKFEHIKENDCETLQEKIFFDAVLAICDGFLPTEKDQIIDAYNRDPQGNKKFINGVHYYNNTFNTTANENSN